MLGLPGWVSWVRYTSYIYYALGECAKMVQGVRRTLCLLKGEFRSTGPPLKHTTHVLCCAGILLFLEFDGRTLYSCVTQGSDGQSIPTNPASPETAPECTPVAK